MLRAWFAQPAWWRGPATKSQFDRSHDPARPDRRLSTWLPTVALEREVRPRVALVVGCFGGAAERDHRRGVLLHRAPSQFVEPRHLSRRELLFRELGVGAPASH